jgi:hypothetical protein
MSFRLYSFVKGYTLALIANLYSYVISTSSMLCNFIGWLVFFVDMPIIHYKVT